MEDIYYVYIIRSESLNKYYAGSTSDLSKRLMRHGKDKSKFTGRASDWKLVKSFELQSKTEALKLELRIKKRGIKRFLEDISVL